MVQLHKKGSNIIAHSLDTNFIRYSINAIGFTVGWKFFLAVFGILAAGLIGMTAPKYRIVRILAAIVWAVSATWGLKLALSLVDMQTNPSPFSTCSFLPEFPAWMPLHEWFPSIMMPTGMCTDVPWVFMGVTMAEWMVVAFSGFLVAWLLFIVPILSGSNKPSLYK